MRHLLVLLSTMLFVSTAFGSGLLAPTDQRLPPLRITDHLVDVEINDGIALTTLTQTFHNDTGQRLEATYVFPLPELADLTDFQMTFNGKMVEGRVLPADEAVRIYESIVRQAKDPGLIEFIGRRLLQMRVFPIEPESDTTIQVKYQQVCRPIGGMMGYHYPLRTRKTAGQAYGTVRFSVDLATTSPLKNVWSPTHAVEIVRPSDNVARIGYEANGGSLEEDFTLLYHSESSDVGLSVVAHKPQSDASGHFVAMLTPKQLWPDEEPQPQDIVFVIDTSGSMAGEKIKQAKSALGYCVDQLGEKDRFSVVRFSTGFDVLFDEPVLATDENRTKAKTFIDKFRAAGGTNIGDTLARVAEMSGADDDDGRPFVVVFLTDGRGNRTPDDVLKMLDKIDGADEQRIFSFGVGHDVNTVLLDRLSDQFTGRPTYVQPGANLELILGDFFSVVSRPVITNVRLVLPGIDATEMFPARLGDLYHGQQLLVAGCFDTELRGPVKLVGERNGDRVEYVWPDVGFVGSEEATYVPSVWAGRKIAYLIDQIRAHGENDELVGEVVALAQQYRIQTPYTSWLVDPENQAGQFARRGGRGTFAGSPELDLGDSFGRARRSLETAAPGTALPRGGGFGGGGGGSGGEGSIFGDPDDSGVEVRLEALQSGVTDEAGAIANLVARKTALLREAESLDGERLDSSRLPVIEINKIWYLRLGQFLVDSTFTDKDDVLTVKFGSEAYFELARGRADLRKALAASRHVVLRTNADHAIVISESDGIEAFSAEQRKEFEVSAD